VFAVLGMCKCYVKGPACSVGCFFSRSINIYIYLCTTRYSSHLRDDSKFVSLIVFNIAAAKLYPFYV